MLQLKFCIFCSIFLPVISTVCEKEPFVMASPDQEAYLKVPCGITLYVVEGDTVTIKYPEEITYLRCANDQVHLSINVTEESLTSSRYGAFKVDDSVEGLWKCIVFRGTCDPQNCDVTINVRYLMSFTIKSKTNKTYEVKPGRNYYFDEDDPIELTCSMPVEKTALSGEIRLTIPEKIGTSMELATKSPSLRYMHKLTSNDHQRNFQCTYTTVVGTKRFIEGTFILNLFPPTMTVNGLVKKPSSDNAVIVQEVDDGEKVDIHCNTTQWFHMNGSCCREIKDGRCGLCSNESLKGNYDQRNLYFYFASMSSYWNGTIINCSVTYEDQSIEILPYKKNSVLLQLIVKPVYLSNPTVMINGKMRNGDGGSENYITYEGKVGEELGIDCNISEGADRIDTYCCRNRSHCTEKEESCHNTTKLIKAFNRIRYFVQQLSSEWNNSLIVCYSYNLNRSGFSSSMIRVKIKEYTSSKDSSSTTNIKKNLILFGSIFTVVFVVSWVAIILCCRRRRKASRETFRPLPPTPPAAPDGPNIYEIVV